jgi:hypothetical protein
MSKKPKRQVRGQYDVQASAQAAPGTTSSRFSGSEFVPDYEYVSRDLKRIGILAGSLFAILVVLSFFL